MSSKTPQDLPNWDDLKSWDDVAWNVAFPILWGCAYHAARQSYSGLTNEDAEDMAATALREVIPQLEKLKDFESLKGLVAVIARRRAISLARKKFAQRRNEHRTESLQALQEQSPGAFELEAIDASALSDIELAELAGLLHRMLLELDELDRNLVIDQIVYGLKHKELAQKYDLPMGTVSSTLARSLEKVREYLQKDPRLGEELRAYLR